MGDKGRHFILLLDESGSVPHKDFENMKKSIASMMNYPLNGQNRVSIIGFSSHNQQKILCNEEHNPEKIMDCLTYDQSEKTWTKWTKYDGWTANNEAFDYIMNSDNNLLLRNYINQVIIFTDGQPNDDVS